MIKDSMAMAFQAIAGLWLLVIFATMVTGTRLCRYYYYVEGRRLMDSYFCMNDQACCNKRQCCEAGPSLTLGFYDLWYFWLCIVLFIVIIAGGLISWISRKYRGKLFRVNALPVVNNTGTVTITATTSLQPQTLGPPPPYRTTTIYNPPPTYHEAVSRPPRHPLPQPAGEGPVQPHCVYSTTMVSPPGQPYPAICTTQM